MDDFGFIIFLAFCVTWILLWILQGKIRQFDQRFEERFSNLIQRVYELESALRQVQHSRPSAADTAPTADTTASVHSPVELVESQRIEPEMPSRVAVPPLETPVEPTVSVEIPSASPCEEMSISSSAERGPVIPEQVRTQGSFEDILGKNWLNKLGIILLVIGIAFFLAYQLKTLGPAGKVLVGFAVSVALLGAGIRFERNERYRILARAGIAGGWALLFFTTYAMYHVPAAHVLSSQLLDLLFMLAVALTMVWHTLRYESQVVTGLAFLLAYLTVFISHVSVYSLAAGVVLAIGIAIIALRRNWFELEVFGILGSYLNHFFWLRPIIDPMEGHRQPFAEFLPSAGILVCYWIIYRASYVLRSIKDRNEELISTVAALLNSALLLGLLKYQSIHPEWAFWALLAAGAVEMALGQLPLTKRRRLAFIVLTTIGAVLLVAAIPFRYSGAHVSVLWLFEAEALVLVGIWTREILFTRLGMLVSFATAAQIIAFDVIRVYLRRLGGSDLSPDYRVGLLVVGVAAAVFYANAHYLARRWADFFSHWLDQSFLQFATYAGGILGVSSIWMIFPELWTAVAWGAFALALAMVSRRMAIRDLAIQANIVSGLALLRVIIVNFSSTEQFRHVSLRLITISAVALLFYLTSHWTSSDQGSGALRLPDAYTWTASSLLVVLMWYELEWLSVALAWGAFGILLFEIGIRQKTSQLRWQGYATLIASFLRIFFVNLNAEPQPGTLSERVYLVVPLVAAFFYVYSRSKEINNSSTEQWFLTAQAWMGTMTVAALVHFELSADWVITGWAAQTFLLLAISNMLRNQVLLQQSLLMPVVVFFRACVYNFYSRGVEPWSVASVAVAIAAMILFVSLFFAFRLRRFESEERLQSQRNPLFFAIHHPEQILFFVPLLMITILLALEMRSGLVTVSWGLEAVVVFLFALLVGERTYRLSGLALLLLCVGKIVVIDVWGLQPRDRYITFIIMGVALLLVSFLYTRYRERIHKFL